MGLMELVQVESHRLRRVQRNVRSYGVMVCVFVKLLSRKGEPAW